MVGQAPAGKAKVKRQEAKVKKDEKHVGSHPSSTDSRAAFVNHR
jgi:hypothetical protein